MPDPKDENLEEDKVAAAYENISKKLESIRNGKKSSDDEEEGPKEENESEKGDEEELEEWKGPKPPSKQELEIEEEELELRKVKLKNLNRDESKDEDDEDEEDEEEAADEEEEDAPEKASKKWEPETDDPLDDDSGDNEESETAQPGEPEEEAPVKRHIDEEESLESDEDSEPEQSNIRRTSESFETEIKRDFSEAEGEEELPKKQPQPDSLDDLTEEKDDYFIPSLKPSGQRDPDLGYNASSQRESFGASYGQRTNMDNMSSSNDPNNFFSQHSQPQPVKRANKFHLLVLVIIGVAVIGFTVYILKGGFGEINLSSQPSPSPSPVETASATPTPTPEPDRAQYKVRVLNGSGKTGLAKTVSDKLKELGYQIDRTGNATNSAFTQTIVRVKANDEAIIPQIVKDLTPDYEAAGNTSLKDDDAADIEVIIGAK